MGRSLASTGPGGSASPKGAEMGGFRSAGERRVTARPRAPRAACAGTHPGTPSGWGRPEPGSPTAVPTATLTTPISGLQYSPGRAAALSPGPSSQEQGAAVTVAAGARRHPLVPYLSQRSPPRHGWVSLPRSSAHRPRRCLQRTKPRLPPAACPSCQHSPEWGPLLPARLCLQRLRGQGHVTAQSAARASSTKPERWSSERGNV